MKLGLAFANTMEFSTNPGAVQLAKDAEAAGFESLWTVEHVVYPDNYGSTYPYDASGKMPARPDTPIPDPLIWLSHLAAVTSTIRLATGILILPERNPLVLAKELATLDDLSGGRVELGIGVGWLREEFDALGIPWEKRGKRTDEYVEAMRVLWTGELVEYSGEFVNFSGVSSNPRPAQESIPIVVGGHSQAAAKRAGRLGNGFFPGRGSLAELSELFDVVRQTAADAGRDASAIEMTAGYEGVFGPDPQAAVQEAAEAGIDRLIAPAFLFMGDGSGDKMAEFTANVLA
jgi:probable F420-dependent oxidoreductase